jgi:hypothetical protein
MCDRIKIVIGPALFGFESFVFIFLFLFFIHSLSKNRNEMPLRKSYLPDSKIRYLNGNKKVLNRELRKEVNEIK